MPFDSIFDDMFGDLGFFESKQLKRLRAELDGILKGIEDGKVKGTFEAREINEPGLKGYVICGRFGSDELPEPLDPLKPLRRRPLPERPSDVPTDVLKEMREPLTDIFEEENTLKIYVELPGEEKTDIKLDATESNLEIRGKSFYKKIDLPQASVATDAMSSKYRNGVLEITIPKRAKLRDKDADKAKMV